MSQEQDVQVRLEKYQWQDEKTKKRQQRTKRIGMFFLLIFVFLFGWIGHAFFFPGFPFKQNEDLRFSEMLDIMSNKWYYAAKGEYNRDDLINMAMKGMTSSDFDPYTEYFSLEELEAFEQGIEQTYSGIGVEMSTDAQYPLIINVFYDSPAEKGGLKVGDYIVAVDGMDIRGLSYLELRPLVMGEIGSKVKITVERGNKRLDYDLIRASISYSVLFKEIKKGIGYIEINTFASTTPNELKHALEELQGKGIKKLIIDLRDNGGGYLESLIKMADFFIPLDAPIFRQDYGKGDIVIHKATSKEVYKFDKIIMLCNNNTASASEVLASCLQDHHIATIVGETTYGKGTSQMIYSFSDGSALKYTQTHWFSANGNAINEVGVIPEYEVFLPEFFSKPTPNLKEEIMVKYDEVSSDVAFVQSGLALLGYSLDRQDGYFSTSTLKALHAFQQDNKLKVRDYIDNESIEEFLSIVRAYYSEHEDTLDTQLAKAIELLS